MGNFLDLCVFPGRPGTHKMLLKREKHRKSYDFRAWRIDFTAVQSTTGEHGEKHLSYEVGGEEFGWKS